VPFNYACTCESFPLTAAIMLMIKTLFSCGKVTTLNRCGDQHNINMLQIFSATFAPNIVKFGQHLIKLLKNEKGAPFMVHSVQSLCYIIVADSMGLSSFKFSWLAPKNVCVLK